MYIVSEHLQTAGTEQLQQLEHEWNISLPQAYVQFMGQYGQGTYCGIMNVEYPNREQLREFVDYEIWEHDEHSPITREQLGECVVIATTIDGDFVAVHPTVESLIWLPRHSEKVGRLNCNGTSWIECMNEWVKEVYGPLDLAEDGRYFEPWNERKQHLFLMLDAQEQIDAASDTAAEASGVVNMNLIAICHECAETMPPDLIITDEYAGLLFYRRMNGYVRFNYAYSREVAVFYEEEQQGEESGFLDRLLGFMHEHGIR
ncbi:SMI1/KNR4 family protein [Paenibacillus sp. Z6-24]